MARKCLMINLSKKLLLLMIAFLWGVTCFANCKTSAIEQAGLSKKQVDALVDLFSGDYELRIYSKEVKGQRRYLMAIGEKHVKDKRSALASSAVNREFDSFAVESSDPKKYFPFFKKIGFDKFYVRKKGENYNSSIDFQSMKDEMIESINEGLIGLGELQDRAEVNIKKLAKHYSQPEDMVAEVYFGVINQFKDKNSEVLQSQVYYVEDNHQPNFREKLSFAGFLLAAHLANYRGLKTIFAGNLLLRLFLDSPVLYPGVHSHEVLSLMIIPVAVLSVDKFFKAFALSENRDTSMVKGLDSSLEEMESKYLIYFVGQKHLPSQEGMLLERGFRVEHKLLNEIEFSPF